VAKLKNISVKEAFKLIHHIKKENLSYNEEFRLKFIEDVYDDESSGAEYADLSFFSRVNNDEEALAYLRGRGLDDKMIEYFDIHYSAGAKRVIFPVYFEDKVVGYQARDITGNQEPKVMSSKGFQKSKFLYNYNQLLYELPDYAVITEGPIDCIKSYKHNSVALFGKELSQDQLNLLLKIPTLKKVYIAIDPEEKDVRAKMMRDLSAFWETMLVPVEAGRDIGDCSLWEVDMLMKNSKSVFDFDDRISII
jgi:DNA primase